MTFPFLSGFRERVVYLRWVSCFTFGMASIIALTAIPEPGLAAAAESGPLGLRQESRPGRWNLQRGDVIAFLGGEDVAAAQHTGHLESLLVIAHAGLSLRFRNFGWEGDTVLAQPREVGFPPLKVHLQRAAVSVIVLQFGRTEALAGPSGIPGFIDAYTKLLDACASQTSRLILVTPPPFEYANALLPDLSARNADLAQYSRAIRTLADKRSLLVVDVFAELGGDSHREPPLTDNGLQITPRGHAFLARAFIRQAGFTKLADLAGEPDEKGAWINSKFERVRQGIIVKNRLWFDYWRPQNWAFLGGDRITQPSSRDHREPNVRWFPAEMEKFIPLIQTKEQELEILAQKAQPPAR